MILTCSVVGLAETDVSQIASDYPYKESAIMATVFRNSFRAALQVQKSKRSKSKKNLQQQKKFPKSLRQWKDYNYGVWTQKGKKHR